MAISKKTTRKKRSRERGIAKSKKVDQATILRYMYVLEQNEMNIAATARELGVVRQTLWKWKEKYWDLYEKQKPPVIAESKGIALDKLVTVKQFGEIKNIMSHAMILCLNRSIEILEDPEQVKKLKFYELTDLTKNIAPYVTDKIATMGANDTKAVNSDQPTFIQNIIKEMNIRGLEMKQNKSKNENNIQDVEEQN